MRGFDFHLTLSDRRGFQPARIGTSSVAGMLTQDGTDFSEKTAGPNGIGTALALGRPVRIFGAEHYSPLYHDFVCCTAPAGRPRRQPGSCIFPSARLIGGAGREGSASGDALRPKEGKRQKRAGSGRSVPGFSCAEVERFELPLAVLETAVLALRRHLYLAAVCQQQGV